MLDTSATGASLEVSITVARRDFPVTVELSIGRGEHFVLFGPSGAGKTTIVEAVAGLVKIDSGEISLGGRVLSSSGPPNRSLPLHQRGIGLVRQDPGLFPHLSVGENIAFSRRLDPESAEVAEVARLLGLSSLLGALPRSLSGGQRQRVALARVIMSNYDVMLLDEPYTGLDAPLARELTHRALELSAEVPSVMVTHHLPTAQHFADRIGVMDMGRLLQIGDAHEVVLRPVSRRVAELVGYLSFVPTSSGLVALHPERILVGAHPDRGPVLSGMVMTCRASGVGYEVELDPGLPGDCATADALGDSRTGTARAFVRVASPASPGDTLTITAVEAPVFR